MYSAVFATPYDARRRLAELGVSSEALAAAVHAGLIARLACTENDPPFIPGTEAWRYVVRTLREELLPLGWRKSDPANFSLISSDKRKLNIVVASADRYVCVPPPSAPRTNSLKGLFAEAAALKNRLESDLFPETVEDELRKAAAVLEYQTWYLLVHITDDVCKAELSLPMGFKDGYIQNWAERIFLPEITFDGGLPKAPDIDDGFDSEIDVPVRRRA